MPGIQDGLGFEEIRASGASAPLQNPFFSGNVVATGDFSGANVFSTAAITAGTVVTAKNQVLTGSADIPTVYDNTGSPYLVGNVYTTFTAETHITGGQWVTVSGKAGGATVLAQAAATETVPVGVAVANATSGAIVNVLTRGACYMKADAGLNNAVGVAMGAGGALNTIKAGGAATTRATVLAGAGSDAWALIYLL